MLDAWSRLWRWAGNWRRRVAVSQPRPAPAATDSEVPLPTPAAVRAATAPRQLSRAEIQALPPYPGLELTAITLVDDDAGMQAAVNILAAAQVVGFDSESRPTFNKGERPSGPHLLQLSTTDHAYLFPLREQTGLPLPLQRLLGQASPLKVGFDLRSDLSMLADNYGLQAQGMLDLVNLFRRAGHRNTVGAVQAVALLFGQHYRKSKSAKMSNWANARLSEQQRRYAANDAFVALQVYLALERDE